MSPTATREEQLTMFVAPDAAEARLDFICANLRLPKPNRGA
ncbi:MAG: hypothetical protein ACRDRA_08915 [Pseudonocardiaceae bacterium]